MKLKRTAVMLLPLFLVTFGTVFSTQLASAEGSVKAAGLGLYWDEECRNPISCIDFGTIATGQSKCVTFWLRSESQDKGKILWNTANFNPSSNWITPYLERQVGRFGYVSNWNKKMKPEDLWKVRYTIQVSQDTEIGVYSWDLSVLHFTLSHKTSVPSVSCILTVIL